MIKKMVFCYPYRLEPSVIVIREASASYWWEQTQRDQQPNIRRSSRNPVERVRGRL